MSWTTRGTYLPEDMTDKERIITVIESDCGLSDESCISLKKLNVPELKRLRDELRASCGTEYKRGVVDGQRNPKISKV